MFDKYICARKKAEQSVVWQFHLVCVDGLSRKYGIHEGKQPESHGHGPRLYR